MTGEYDVTEVLPATSLDELGRGTNVALVGPSMSGKRELALRLLATGYETGNGILCVTTENAAQTSEDLERHLSALERAHIGIINCSGSDTQMIQEMTEHVSSPGDLTGISIGMARLFRQFNDRGISDIRYGLISVSTLLQYLRSEKVFKFLHIYTNRVSETEGFGIYTLNNDSHDPQVVNTISGQFDGIIELRETERGERECRVRGFGRSPTPWLALD